jgi:hypothetical protein
MHRCCSLLLFLTISLTLFGAEPDYAREGEAWWARVKFLANDSMEGRNTGSDGYRKAADYVAAEFQRLGLKPAGAKNYFQPVKFRVRQIIEETSRLELSGDGSTEPLSLADDANISLPVDTAAQINAPAVFAGYGLVIPEMGINDLAGLNLKGKIVVVLSGGPKEVPGAVRAHYSHPKQQWTALKRAGAIGMATIRNPKSMDIPWSRATLARLQPVMSLADRKLDDMSGMKISLRINAERADKFFAGTDHTISELLKLSDENKPLPKFALRRSVKATIAMKKSEVNSPNVVGELTGNDPRLKSEYLVLSAHLDHLGIGEPIDGDSIYNGALDNAAGVASLLEVARKLKESGAGLNRSVLFLMVTGEEKGLQGSKYFAHHPTVPQPSIVANINTDMFLPLYPLKKLRVLGLGESSLGDEIGKVCSEKGIAVQPDPEPARNSFIRSDQYSFICQGIPSLVFGFGYELNSPEHLIHKEWLKNRYHAPSDDLNQPVDKAAAAQFNEILLTMAQSVANTAERPAWKPTSFFRRFERK